MQTIKLGAQDTRKDYLYQPLSRKRIHPYFKSKIIFEYTRLGTNFKNDNENKNTWVQVAFLGCFYLESIYLSRVSMEILYIKFMKQYKAITVSLHVDLSMLAYPQVCFWFYCAGMGV